MGICMTKKSQGFHPKSILAKRVVNNDANPLLDQWNEKHIEILRGKFYEFFKSASDKQRNGGFNSGGGADSGGGGLDKQAFMKVFADLKSFPKQVAESAFRLFDRDRSGYIDFREFCCGLSIICLSSTNEKIRFVFDLFDLDRDGFLNRQELRMLLETAVMSLRKFCKGPGDQVDKLWIDHHFKLMMNTSVQSNSSLNNEDHQQHQQQVHHLQMIDFFTFKKWAERNLNVYHLLNTFMLVPSPVKERKTIVDILSHYERKHGDTMYAVSFRWWEMWKEYTSQHQSTKDQNMYVDLIKQSLAEQDEAPEMIRNFLIPYYEEQKDADINEIMQRQDLMDYTSNNIINSSLKKEYSKARLTPRSERGASALEFPAADLDGIDNQSILEDSGKHFVNKKGLSQHNAMMKLKEQHYHSKRSQNYSSQISRDEANVSHSINVAGGSFHEKKHSFIAMNNPTPSQEPFLNQPDLQQVSYTGRQSFTRRTSKPRQKQELFEGSMYPISSQPSVILEEEVSHNDLRFSQSFKYFSNSQAVERPTEIDNTDIEGEHPGQLKPNLILHRDFIMIPEEAWQCLQKWYGGGPAFPRKVIINNTIPTIELYPPLITSVLAGTDGNPIQDSSRTLFVSIAMKLSEVFLKVCESFNYISTKEARLWFKSGGINQWKLIERDDLEKTLEDFIVKDGDVFMVEMRFSETWPRDQFLVDSQQHQESEGKPNQSQNQQMMPPRDWRNFEVGDRIDILDNNEWKIGIIQRVMKDKLMIHLLNEHWKNNVVVPKNSELIDKYGKHTLEMHFRNTNSLSNEDIPNDFSGIENIGNTCYMSAVLQPLFHTPLFREFFLSKQYIQHLNPKKYAATLTDKETVKKQVANQAMQTPQMILALAFGELLAETVGQTTKINQLQLSNSHSSNILPSFQNTASTQQQQAIARRLASVAPIAFKKVVNMELPMFFGAQQHDSQEFLSFFLDKISEDLNRVDIEEELKKQKEERELQANEQKKRTEEEAKANSNNATMSPSGVILQPNSDKEHSPEIIQSPQVLPQEPALYLDQQQKNEQNEQILDGGTGGQKVGNQRASTNNFNLETIQTERQQQLPALPEDRPPGFTTTLVDNLARTSQQIADITTPNRRRNSNVQNEALPPINQISTPQMRTSVNQNSGGGDNTANASQVIVALSRDSASLPKERENLTLPPINNNSNNSSQNAQNNSHSTVHQPVKLPAMTTNEQIYHSYFQPNIGQSQNMKSQQQLLQRATPAKENENSQANGSNALNKREQRSNQGQSSSQNLHGQIAVTSQQIDNISPLLLDPSLSEAERKAIESWQRELKMQNSAVSDLFVGQQGTTVYCQQCRHKSYAFENFYTLSLPLPYNSNAIFYITVMKRSTSFVIPPVVKYGIQIDKNAKLNDLMREIEILANLKESRMAVAEIANNKFYRIHSGKDDETNNHALSLRTIYRRTNELTVFECFQRIQEMPVKPQLKRKALPQRTLLKPFRSFLEIKMGTILDAQDAYGKWYVGIVVDKEFNFELKQCSIKVHFFEFPERWDEWYKDIDGLNRIAPFGAYAEEPKDKIISMTIMHRKKIPINETQAHLNSSQIVGNNGMQTGFNGHSASSSQNPPEQSAYQYQTFGMPFYLSIGNWYTWEDAYVEIVTQAQRFIKQSKFSGTKSQRGVRPGKNGKIVDEEEERKIITNNGDGENISDEDMGEEKSSKICKYDSSYFSKKMAEVDKKGAGQYGLFVQHNFQLPGRQIDMLNNPTPQTLEQRSMSKKGLNYSNEQFGQQSPGKKGLIGDLNQEIQFSIDNKSGNPDSKISSFLLRQQQANSIAQSHRQIPLTNNAKSPILQRSFHDTILMQGLTMQEENQIGQSMIMYGGGGGGTLGAHGQNEFQRLPFTVSILDAESHLCAICLYKSKYIQSENNSKQREEQVICKGCDIYQTNEKVKWILSCFKRLEVCIDWHDTTLYKNPLISSDITCLKFLQQEKELQSGIPLSQCFELFTKRDQIDDYACDQCKKNTPAMVDTKISRAPDILIIHLKRFSYQSGYLEKIEDLVNFPINNLDISPYLSSGFKRHKASSSKSGLQRGHQYDLYAVVNHIMYHNAGGGHYTAYVMSDQQQSTASQVQVHMSSNQSSQNSKKQGVQLWFKCNDASISRIDKADIISKDAYILFYKRKEFTASNIINFTAAAF